MKLLVDVSSAWCGVQEPGAPATPGDAMVRQVPDDQALEVLVPLYEALEADLRAGGPSTQLAGIAHEYFQQAAVACAEAEAAALLSLAWTGLIPKQLAVSKAQDTIQGLTFPQAVFSRWPVWELMAHLSRAPPRGLTKDLEVSSCLSFEPCKRTVAFYKQRRIELLAPGLRCPPPSEKLRLAYSEGVLLVRSNLSEDFVPDQRGITWIPELRVTDISRVVQRMSAEEVEATSSFIARYLPQRRVSALELPLRLEWEGVQITSQVHQYGELHLEPQPLSSASNPRPPGPSIYLLILESASRAGFEAYCPLTMAFLRRQRKGGAWRAKDLGLFHAFLGGTVANMLPALSGFSYDKVKDSDRRATWDCDVVLDGIPEDRLIWNVAKKHGYKTIFGASGCNGFLGTRYCRNRLQEFDRVAPSLEVDPNCHSQNEWRLIVQERNRSRGCVGEKRPHEHLLNYFLRFQEIHADVPIFAYLHLEAAHEAQEALQLLDKALLSHLEGLSRLPPEARPVVVLAGDHGPPDMCDESFPFVSLLMPEARLPVAQGPPGSPGVSGTKRRAHEDQARAWRRYLWNLDQNRFVITSWFDVYATFRQLIGDAGDVQNLWQWDAPDHRAQSLLSRISQQRTCTQAGVPEWHCACARSWVGWCPLSERGKREVAERALQEAQDILEVTAAKFRANMSICRPQRLEKVLSCESQLNTLQRLQRKLWGAGEGERSVLRLRVLSTQGMEFQFYAYMLFKSNSGDFQDLEGHVEEVFKLFPRSPYAPNEPCTPRPLDPAFCACAPEAQLRLDVRA